MAEEIHKVILECTADKMKWTLYDVNDVVITSFESERGANGGFSPPEGILRRFLRDISPWPTLKNVIVGKPSRRVRHACIWNSLGVSISNGIKSHNLPGRPK